MSAENNTAPSDASQNNSPSDWQFHGSENADLLLLGQSHTIAFWHAIDRKMALPMQIATLRSGKGYKAPDDSYWQIASEKVSPKTVAILWEGNQHNTSAGLLFKQAKGFTFALDANFKEAFEAGSPIVPTTLIRKYFQSRSGLGGLRKVIDLLSLNHQVVVLGTPPPKSSEFVLSLMSQKESVPEIGRLVKLNLQNEDLHLNPTTLRVALWNVLQDATREIALSSGAKFIPVPKVLSDQDGSLREIYNWKDVTHASPDYAAEYLVSIAPELLHEEN